jgi:DNA-binding CsgD family transcriptional regulator
MLQSSSAGNKKVLARIQRLCCLGIGSEMVMPDLLREVSGMLHTRHQAFRWRGPNGGIVNDYSSFSRSHTELYLKEFNGSAAEAEVIASFDTRVMIEEPVSSFVLRGENTLRVGWSDYVRSDYYNLLWRAVDIYHQLNLIVRDPVRMHGILYVYRSASDAPFTPNDISILLSIGGFVAHSMARADDVADGFVETEDRALIVTATDGRVLHATDEGQRLLMMALSQRFAAPDLWGSSREPAPEIVALCRLLAAAAEGRIGQPPPVRFLRTIWGLLVLRAYWLGPTDGSEQNRHIGITIARRVPRALALHRRIEDLPLTNREKQLCLLLAHDHSRHDLAEAMGVTTGTVITHQSNIYAKLGVHSRSALLAALLPGVNG